MCTPMHIICVYQVAPMRNAVTCSEFIDIHDYVGIVSQARNEKVDAITLLEQKQFRKPESNAPEYQIAVKL